MVAAGAVPVSSRELVARLTRGRAAAPQAGRARGRGRPGHRWPRRHCWPPGTGWRVVAPAGPADPDRLAAGLEVAARVGPGRRGPRAAGGERPAWLAGADEARAAALPGRLARPAGPCRLVRPRRLRLPARAGPPRLAARWPTSRPRWLVGFSDVTALHQAFADPARDRDPARSRASPGWPTPTRDRGVGCAALLLEGTARRSRRARRAGVAGEGVLVGRQPRGPRRHARRPRAVARPGAASPCSRTWRRRRTGWTGCSPSCCGPGGSTASAGVACGAFTGCGDTDQVRALLLARLAPLGVPLVLDLPLGHGVINRALPLGRPARLDGAPRDTYLRAVRSPASGPRAANIDGTPGRRPLDPALTISGEEAHPRVHPDDLAPQPRAPSAPLSARDRHFVNRFSYGHTHGPRHPGARAPAAAARGSRSSWPPAGSRTPRGRRQGLVPRPVVLAERSCGTATSPGVGPAWEVMADLGRWTMMRRVLTSRQLHEVMVEFWSNLLHIPLGDDSAWPYRVSYDAMIRDARARPLRRHAGGGHDARRSMGLYLDNAISTKDAPNENLGRELLELHSVGVDAGYTEKDVLNSARILTGYRVDLYWPEFKEYYDHERHYTGTIKVLGLHVQPTPKADGRDGHREVHPLPGPPPRHGRAAGPPAVREVRARRAVRRAWSTPVARPSPGAARTSRPPCGRWSRTRSSPRPRAAKVRMPLEETIATIRALGIKPRRSPSTTAPSPTTSTGSSRGRG